MCLRAANVVIILQVQLPGLLCARFRGNVRPRDHRHKATAVYIRVVTSFVLAIALSNREMKRVHALLVLSLALVAAVGWAGVFARKYYSALHFVEPWAEIAEEAATSVQRGGFVINNNPSFRF